MFSACLTEKNQKEINLRGWSPQDFQLFIDATDNINSISDTNVEKALFLADFLHSSTLERQCLEHLRQNTDYNLKEQLQLAQNTNPNNLLEQICNSIKDAEELDELLPNKLGTLSAPALAVALQRCFQFHGLRKPSPTLLQPEQKFEFMVNRIIDQAELSNDQGSALADQLILFEDDLWIDRVQAVYMAEIDQEIIGNDLQLKKLMERCQSARDLMEQNYFQAQAQVLKLKHLFTLIENVDPDAIGFEKDVALLDLLKVMRRAPRYINQNKGNRPGARELALGDRPVDETYRILLDELEDQVQRRPQGLDNNPLWLRRIQHSRRNDLNAAANIDLPVDDRQVSAKANFAALDTYIRIFRNNHHIMLAEIQAQQQNEDQN